MRSLIIHLPRATARAENVSRLMDVLPDPQIVEAVDGQIAEQISVPLQKGDLYEPSYPFELSNGEIACFLSHRRCWKMIADGDEPYALIAEDDLEVLPQIFGNALSLAQRYADQDSYIRLPAKAREKASGLVARQGGASMFVPRTIGLQAVCQIVGREAAKRLWEATAVMDRPVDTTLQMHWVTGQRIQTVWPSGVSEMGAPSTIQSKTRTSDLLMRELRRARYRALIRRKPQVG